MCCINNVHGILGDSTVWQDSINEIKTVFYAGFAHVDEIDL